LPLTTFRQAEKYIIYSSLIAMAKDETPIDLTQLTIYLDSRDLLAKAGGIVGVTMLAEGSVINPSPSKKSFDKAVEYLVTIDKRSTLANLLPKLRRELLDLSKPFENVTAKSIQALEQFLSNDRPDNSGLTAMGATIADTLETIFKQCEDQENGVSPIAMSTGFVDLDAHMGGWQRGDFVVIGAIPGMGKAQPISTPIKTIDGWKAIGDLKLGDVIASVDGLPNEVVGYHPRGFVPTYKITFSDGRSTECCEDHLWTVNSKDWSKEKAIDTKTLVSNFLALKQKDIYIPTCNGQFGGSALLPIDPYILGCLIGDGCLSKTCPEVSNPSSQVIENIKRLLPKELKVTSSEGSISHRIVLRDEYRKLAACVDGHYKNPLMESIKEMGLYGTHAESKFIPIEYLNSSFDNRIKLLQGLVDTDGWVEKHGSIRYSTASKQLAIDMQSLVRSLGGYCEIKTKETFFTSHGQPKQGQLAYTFTVCGLNHLPVCTLDEKLERIKPTIDRRRLKIASVEFVGLKESVCITVSHPSHLYICNDYIVTHNSAFAVSTCLKIAQAGHPVAFFSLEMTTAQMQTRCLSMTSGVSSSKIRDRKLSPQDKDKLLSAAATLTDLSYWGTDKFSSSIDFVVSESRKLAAKQGKIGAIAVDYIQLLVQESANSINEISDITRRLKSLAIELDCTIFGLSQLNRAVAARNDKRPVKSDLRSCGSIEQDADIVLMLYRDETVNPNSMDKGVAEIGIVKFRNGQEGTIKLAFDGATTQFKNLAKY
jgi:replicative DNA helicase